MSSIWLVEIEGDEAYSPDSLPCSVGRNSINGIQLNHSAVSRIHFRLGEEAGHSNGPKYWIEPFETKNNTLLNGEILAPDTRRFLQEGDVLEIGPVGLRFEETRPAIRQNSRAPYGTDSDREASATYPTVQADDNTFRARIERLYQRHDGNPERMARDLSMSPNEVRDILQRIGLVS